MKLFLFTVLFFLGILSGISGQEFGVGNLVLVRVDGSNPANSGKTSPVFLDEYKINAGGSLELVSSRPFPVASAGLNKAFTLNSGTGRQASEGYISLSPDNKWLTMFGYSAAPGTNSPHTTIATTLPRVIALIDGDGNIDTRTVLTDVGLSSSTTSIMSAATSDGNNIWLNGGDVSTPRGGAIRYTTKGSSASTRLTPGTSPAQVGQLQIFGDQLYASASTSSSSGSVVNKPINGLETTSPQTVTSIPNLENLGNSGGGYIFFDTDPAVPGIDLLYVIAGVTSSQKYIRKYTFNGSAWTFRYQFRKSTPEIPYSSLTGKVINGKAVLYAATAATGTGGRIMRYEDNVAATTNNPDLVVYTEVVPGQADQYLRGITYAPAPIVRTAPAFAFSLGSAAVKNFGDPDFEIPAPVTNSDGVVSYRTDPAVSTVAQAYRDINDGNKWKIKITGTGTVGIIADIAITPVYTAASSAPAILTVNKGTPVINFDLSGLSAITIGDPDIEIPAAGSNNPAAITYESADPAIAETYLDAADHKWKIRITGAGATGITAKQAADVNWNEGSATQPLVINKAPQVLTFTTVFPDKIYGDATFSFAPAASNTLTPIYYESSDPAVAEPVFDAGSNSWQIVIRKAGNVTITAHQAGTATYLPAASAGQSLLIRKKALTLTADNKSKLAGDPNPVFTFSSNGFIAGEDNTVFTTQPQLTTTADLSSPAGDYPITFIVEASAANYEITHINGILSIGELQTIQFPVLSNIVYGAPAFDPGATSNSNTAPVYSSGNTAVAIIDANNKVQIVGTGTARIIASFPASGSYVPTTAEQSFQVVKKLLLITADNKSRTYGAANPILTASYDGFVYGETSDMLLTRPAVTTTATTASPVGTYPVTASGAAAANYDISYQPGTLAVTKAQLTATAEDKHKIQGDPNPPFTISYSGFVNGENASVLSPAPVAASVATVSSPAGEYPITVSGGAASNYDFIYIAGRLTVQPLQTVSFPALPTVIYGASPLTLNAASDAGTSPVYSSDNTAVAVIEGGNRVRVAGAGTATIRASFPATSVYAATTITQLLTVQQKEVVVTAADQTRRYKQPDPVFTYSFSGFVSGETNAVLATQPSISTTATQSSGVGVYPILVTGAAAANYRFTYVPGSLTITQETRTLTFNPLINRTYGIADYDPGASLTSGEIVEYSSSNTGVATIVNNKIHIAGAGTTTITASAPANSNYTTTPVQAHDLLVSKASQTITFRAIPALQNDGSVYTATATASSGLPVTLTVEDPLLASVNGLQVKPLHRGETRITASQPGDVNYLAATAVRLSLIIEDPAGEDIIIGQALSPNGDGINDKLMITGIKDFPRNYVVIFDRNGNMVFEQRNYDNISNAFTGKKNNSDKLLPPGTYFYKVEYQTADLTRKVKTGYIVIKYAD